MGVIMTIRNRFGYLLVGLIALAIIGFLVMDTTNSRTGIFARTTNTAGKVNGEELTIQDYQKQISEGEENLKQNAPDGNVPEDSRFMVAEQTWDNFVRKTILGNQYDKLGIDVTTDEMFELLQGKNPHPMVKQYFTNPQTGRFDPEGVTKFVESLDEEDPNGNVTSDQKKKKWQNFKDFIKEDRLSTKYFTLVRKGIYMPNWEAKKLYEVQQSKVTVDYVLAPFQDIADDQVKITDSDLKDYLNRHQAEYKQDESRAVEYISYPLVPSKTDTTKTLDALNDQLAKFKTAKSDSLFIRLYSDKTFDPSFLKKEQLQSSIADTFFKIDTGTYVGPYIEKDTFIVAKLLKRKMIADSVKAREVVIGPIKTQKDYDTNKALADSLQKALEEGKANFDSLVVKLSADPQSKAKGGDMGWIQPNPKSVLNAPMFFEHKEGDYFVLFAGNAFRLIHITNAKPEKMAVKVAFLAKAILPSNNTKDSIFAEANKFAGLNNTGAKFKEAAKTKSVRQSEPLTSGSYKINGVGLCRDIIKWAYGAQKDDVSKVFKLEDKYVIAHLVSTKEKGFAKVDDVRQELEPKVRQEKKAELLKEKLKDAKDLASAAAKTGKQVKSGADLGFNNFLLEGAAEPKLPAAALGLKTGAVSTTVTGNTGVFIVQLKALSTPPEITDFTNQKRMAVMMDQQRVQDQVFNLLKDAATIKDERMKQNIY